MCDSLSINGNYFGNTYCILVPEQIEKVKSFSCNIIPFLLNIHLCYKLDCTNNALHKAASVAALRSKPNERKHTLQAVSVIVM